MELQQVKENLQRIFEDINGSKNWEDIMIDGKACQARVTKYPFMRIKKPTTIILKNQSGEVLSKKQGHSYWRVNIETGSIVEIDYF